MKDIFELYNECDGSICSTPTNTLGAGNPMLPGENGEVGSELLCGKCKKEKAKKKKIYIEPKLKESLLGNMEDNLKIGEIELEFINWFADEQCKEYKTTKKEEVVSELVKCVHIEGKDTAVIDLFNNRGNYTLDEIIIHSNLPPANIKTIKVINVGRGTVNILSKMSDLSMINFEIYSDEKRSCADIDFSFRKLPNNVVIKLGKIICNRLMFIINSFVSEVEINKNSVILDLNLANCHKLTGLSVDYANVPYLSVRSEFIKQLLHKHNIIPWGTEIDIR